MVIISVVMKQSRRDRRDGSEATQRANLTIAAASVRLTASFWQVTRFAWMTDDERVTSCRRRRSSCSSTSLIRIAVAKREDDDELRIRCRSAINWQNPPPIYRQIGRELTMLCERDVLTAHATTDEWTLGRAERVARISPLIFVTLGVDYPPQVQNKYARI